MFNKIIEPRFGDTDALGHINNVTMAQWFELARNDLYRLFHPDTYDKFQNWSMIMAHSSYDFLAETKYGSNVEVRTFVEKIGFTSFTLFHELWQGTRKTVTGRVVIVHFDFATHKPTKLPDEYKEKLKTHLIQK